MVGSYHKSLYTIYEWDSMGYKLEDVRTMVTKFFLKWEYWDNHPTITILQVPRINELFPMLNRETPSTYWGQSNLIFDLQDGLLQAL